MNAEIAYSPTAGTQATEPSPQPEQATNHASKNTFVTSPSSEGSATKTVRQQVEKPKPSPKRIAARLAAVGIAGNIALSAAKLLAGIFGNSSAMISDAVHSLSDVFATAIAYAGVKIAGRAADAGHPFGHERFECIASLALGLILAATGLVIGYTSLEAVATRSYLQAATPGAVALGAAALSIVVKEAMFWYTRHWARKLNSAAFMADAWHHRSDALSSIGALAGIAASMAGFAAGDAIASFAICIVILKVAFDVLKDALGNMTDEPCDRETERAIETCIAETCGVVRIDELRTRKFGNRIYVEAEIAVDGTLTLSDAHDIAETAHNNVEASFEAVKHIMIHENPA